VSGNPAVLQRAGDLFGEARVEQAARRDVDGDRDLQAAVEPVAVSSRSQAIAIGLSRCRQSAGSTWSSACSGVRARLAAVATAASSDSSCWRS
jgi:hypothetical protein